MVAARLMTDFPLLVFVVDKELSLNEHYLLSMKVLREKFHSSPVATHEKSGNILVRYLKQHSLTENLEQPL